jgi:hypothetical protein
VAISGDLAESFTLHKLADALRARYPAHVGFVQMHKLKFYEDLNPEPEESSPAIQISGLSRAEWRKLQEERQDDTRYIITVVKAIWDALNTSQQQWLMFEMLYAIDRNQEGKIRKRDVVEYAPIVEHLGVHWRQQGVLPDLLNDDYPIALPAPPADHDVPDF